MANGDFNNVLMRLKGAMPPWFPSIAPVKDAILSGMAASFKLAYDALMLAKANMRIPSTTGYFLDLAAYDFFGVGFKRITGQSDASFAAAIVREIFRERVTPRGVVLAVEDRTGGKAALFEPFDVRVCGGYGFRRFYGRQGQYGNLAQRGQAYLDAATPPAIGQEPLAGYGSPAGGYGRGRWAYAVKTIASIDDVFRTILNTKAAGIVIWARFVPPRQLQYPVMLLGPDANGNQALIVTSTGLPIILSFTN